MLAQAHFHHQNLHFYPASSIDPFRRSFPIMMPPPPPPPPPEYHHQYYSHHEQQSQHQQYPLRWIESVPTKFTSAAAHSHFGEDGLDRMTAFDSSSPSIMPRSISNQMSSSTKTNVYLRYLPATITTNDLFSKALHFGRPLSIRLVTDKSVAFLMFPCPLEAHRAIQGFQSMGFEASLAKSSTSTKLRSLADTESTNLYLSNLPADFSELELADLFYPDRIDSMRIVSNRCDEYGSPRGIAFVRLLDRATAEEAIVRLQEARLPRSSIPLSIRFSDTKQQKDFKASLKLINTSRMQSEFAESMEKKERERSKEMKRSSSIISNLSTSSSADTAATPPPQYYSSTPPSSADSIYTQQEYRFDPLPSHSELSESDTRCSSSSSLLPPQATPAASSRENFAALCHGRRNSLP